MYLKLLANGQIELSLSSFTPLNIVELKGRKIKGREEGGKEGKKGRREGGKEKGREGRRKGEEKEELIESGIYNIIIPAK